MAVVWPFRILCRYAWRREEVASDCSLALSDWLMVFKAESMPSYSLSSHVKPLVYSLNLECQNLHLEVRIYSSCIDIEALKPHPNNFTFRH